MPLRHPGTSQEKQVRESSRRAAVRATVVAVAVVGAMALGVFAVPGGTARILGAVGLAPAVSACSVTVTHENEANDAIQLAIQAFPGGTICVGPGAFPEQLTITHAGTTLRGAGDTRTVLDPASPLVINTFDYDSASAIGDLASLTPAAAIVLVENTTGVTVSSIGVNGASGSTTFSAYGCADNYYGIDFQNSSGTATSDLVTGIQLPSDLFGCQDGLAIYAYNGYFLTGVAPSPAKTVSIVSTTVTAFDKNGITCDDPGQVCLLTSDVVTGIGPTPLIAQNGIQIGFGAKATVHGGTISQSGDFTGSGGCSGSGQSAYAVCTGNEGAGILLYDPATGTSITATHVVRNEYGIDLYDDGNASNGYQGPVAVTIENDYVASSAAYGIVTNGAPGGNDSATIEYNDVTSSSALDASTWGSPGILVDTGHFVVEHNTIVGASTSTRASNGASQILCGPDANTGPETPYLTCAVNSSIPTAAIEGASENSSNPTVVTVYANTFSADFNDLETIGVLGGAVNVDWV